MGKTRQLVPIGEVPEHRSWANVRYLRRLVHERRIPYHKLGDSRSARVYIDLADLDRFTEGSRVEAAWDRELPGAARRRPDAATRARAGSAAAAAMSARLR
jgi:hypothetical protein